MPIDLEFERKEVKNYLNNHALRNWVIPLNGPRCTHDPAKATPSFRINRSQNEDWYSVLTEWTITAQNPSNNNYSRSLLLEVFLFGQDHRQRPSSYEIRMAFRQPPGLLQAEINSIRQICSPLFQQEGFANNGYGYPIDFSKNFNKPPIYQNVIPDIAQYIGPLHNNGQHLEPYIRSIINAI